MKSPRNPLKPHLLELAAAGREMAAAPLAPEALRIKLMEMAKLGFHEVAVGPLLDVDVRSTATAGAGIAYLGKEKIETQWRPANALPESDRNPARVVTEYYELVIRIRP